MTIGFNLTNLVTVTDPGGCFVVDNRFCLVVSRATMVNPISIAEAGGPAEKTNSTAIAAATG